ncbi:MAG: glycoside hydrolase family 38 C-terminal domain-containing protein [Fimbriimonadaceae bacterium]
MLKHPKTTFDRARQFVERELLEKLVSDSAALVTQFCLGEFPNEVTARKEGAWKEAHPGFKWGPAYREGWYRVTGKVPTAWKGREIAIAYGEPTVRQEKRDMVEGTVWSGGRQVGGLDHGHCAFRLPTAEGGEKLDLLVQTYAHNAETRVHGTEPPRSKKPEAFRGFFLVALDADLWPLYFDCEFAVSLCESQEEDSQPYHALLRGLNDVCNTYDRERPATISACRKALRDAMAEVPGSIGHTITPVGHAHLDTAWLWPLSVTRLKMAHTTAVQLDLIERFPEHVFAHSQASQYEWLEQQHPDLLERVKRAVKSGQWEVVGSMWVEADCNLTGGESLVRQFLYGRRYFREQFGVTTEDMWLPDVFGYSAAIPQILAGFGITSFMTQKLSWNQYNKIPHDTFWWKGIDSTSVWTHFLPAHTYCSTCTPSHLLESVKNYKDHGRCDRSLYVFGFGDGGGGPTEFHIERLRRARTASGMPTIERKKTALDFFRTAQQESRDLMTWSGELYFELHRGTYTSQAANKRGNRECEFLLRDAEWLACFSDGFPKAYPARELEALWKTVLLNQFHDIIPGSSVREVYEESARDYARVRKDVGAIIDAQLERFASQFDTSEMERPVALFHNSSVPSQAELPWEGRAPKSIEVEGERYPVQAVEAFGERKIVFKTPEGALGAVVVGDLSRNAPTVQPRVKAGPRKIENGEFAVRFDANGNITSVRSLDDDPVEFVAHGALANVLQVFDDHPLFWDAWDVEAYNLETVQELTKCESFELVEEGPVRAAVEVVRKFGSSTFRQRISVGPTPGIRFDTEVDWREENRMLKVAFPVAVSSQRATYEIQFGHVERPTHSNTSWDMAQFEVCAQKWADLSEGGHGVALINDGKYGHDIKGNVMRLTLLRSPKSPDPTCDIGVHRFSYVLLPHYDQVQHSDVVAASYAFNAPVRAALVSKSKGRGARNGACVGTDTRSVVVEAVKKAEDSDRIVVRAYECHNSRGRAELLCAMPVKRAWLADMEENPVQELEVNGAVKFEYRPFEILTVVLEV